MKKNQKISCNYRFFPIISGAMRTQREISEMLGIHQSEVSRLLNGKIPVRWPLAEKLADIFPNKSLRDWKYASPEQIKRALSALKKETV